REKGMDVDMNGFHACLEQQKERSRAASAIDTDDWVVLREEGDVEFVGYDELECDCHILRYRKVKSKNKEQFQLVLNKTPFYAESGGQVGDTGTLTSANEKVTITDTQKENNLIIQFCDRLPEDLMAEFHATVNRENRRMITNNHSATHLMHSALKRVLGDHVNQKGSLVNTEHTRFDFSHFTKVTDEEIARIEQMVNEKIRENIRLEEQRNVPVQKAMEMGATALFGEKYGEYVRVITFDPNFSRELCGGTHVSSTGQIGLFKIISEGAVAAGVRRIEAITADKADAYYKLQEEKLSRLNEILKNPKDLTERVKQLLDENNSLQEKMNQFINQKAQGVKNELITKSKSVNGINVIVDKLDLPTADSIKNISFELKNQIDNLFFLAGAEIDGKAHLSLIISEHLIKEKNLNAMNIIRELSKEIQGGGGGQPFYATAGGKNPEGIDRALEKGRSMISGLN
ncbi:MAG TPA: alanine--tRNA ligase-related protein, partial [Bacteroidia bacterium]|nr:alanine--tRNA ligase-related protein [Bacteroidia bacterium]